MSAQYVEEFEVLTVASLGNGAVVETDSLPDAALKNRFDVIGFNWIITAQTGTGDVTLQYYTHVLGAPAERAKAADVSAAHMLIDDNVGTLSASGHVLQMYAANANNAESPIPPLEDIRLELTNDVNVKTDVAVRLYIVHGGSSSPIVP